MNRIKNSLVLVSVLLIVTFIVFILAWLNSPEYASYIDLQTVLTTSTATFGTILGIITAGLMFTQGRFSELSSELSEKSPNYLMKEFSLEKIQSIGNRLLFLQKTYVRLAEAATVVEEKSLYQRIVAKATSMIVDSAVLLDLELKQKGFPESALLASEMGSTLYKVYEKRRKNVKKEWHMLKTIKQIVDVWEAPASFFVNRPSEKSALHSDLNNSISILKLKENIDKSSAGIRAGIEEATENVEDEIGRIGERLRKDRIPQLLSQIEQASVLRGKYFYLTLVFIAVPFLINLLILPQLSEATVVFFRQIVSVTSLLSVMGVVFLLLYIHKILNV